jgi:hypothetical protein
MASSYTSNSGIEKPAEGDQTGEWGDTVNTNMDIIDRSINGVGAITLSGTTHTLTTTDGTLSDGMYKVLVLGGSPSGTNTITISPNDQDKVYIVVNGSGQTATFTQGSGGNVSVLNGDSKIIYADGAGSGAAVVDVTADLSFSSVNIDGGTIDGTAIGGASAAAGSFTTLDTSSTVNLNLTTDSSSSTSGALIIDGGVGIAKKLYVGTDADIDGTLEADAMTLNGTAITTTATLSTGISNTNVPVFTTGVADDDFLRVAGTSIEGRSASEVLSDIGGQASLTFGISNTNAVKIDSASVADDEYARFTADGLESRSTAEVLSDIGGQASLTFGISNTNAVKIDSASVADDEYARFTASGLESRSTAEVLSDIGGQASLTFGISNTNAVKIDSSSVADDEYARFTANGLESRSTAEVLSDIGGQASLTFGISNTNAVKIDSASVADDEYARFTANGLESRSTSEVLSDIGASAAAGSSSIVTTGALDAGSITSGFGTINNGSSAITTTGLISGGSLDIDDVVINGSTIGHTDDTDLITVADGIATVAGEVSMTTLDIGGTNVTSTAAELNYLDITTLGTTQASKAVTTDASGDVLFPDGDKIKLGTGSDLQIYHDASNSYVEDAGTGLLVLKGSQVNINSSGDESMAAFVTDGAATLYHNNVAKLATTATGVTVTGDISTVTSINTGQIANRNAVQNGAMMVDQKGGTTTLSGYSAAKPDRFTAFVSNAGTQTVAQDSEAPAGFHKSLKATNTVVDSSIASGDRAAIIYRLEGNDAARFAFGGSDAKTVTLSFYVRSSITGTHGGALGNGADNRAYPFTYAISSANTWERKSITIAGDTTGTWATSTARSMQIVWGLGVGSTNSGTAGEWAAADYNSATGATTAFLTTLNATWYLTGVQLEEGSTATDFEHKSFSQEFTACSRYFQKSYTDVYTGFTGFGIAGAAGAWRERVNFNGYMRAGPTMAYTNLGTGWSAANINSCESHFTVELSKNTADVRPNFQYTASAEL